jgi:hypothetical protein
MNFISSNELNKKKWDDLVAKNKGAFYSKSEFLDIMSKNWGVYVNESYTKGVAICFNKIFYIKLVYPCIFSKTTEFINLNNKEAEEIIAQIKKDFSQGSIYLSEIFKTLKVVSNQVYQELNEDKFNLNNQAKRMLKKAVKSGHFVKEISINSCLELILTTLSLKINEIDRHTFSKIESLILHLNLKNEIIAFGIFDINSELQGGQVFHIGDSTITYLTGACLNQSREQGGMYLCMNEAINFSFNQSKVVNFGGSNIENIRRFYTSFGGQDVTYYKHEWNNSPVWFKLIKKVKLMLKK